MGCHYEGTELIAINLPAEARKPEMDGLRGIACLIVLILHPVALMVPASQPYITGIPKIGVWLFFALSAFLLTIGLIERGFGARSLAQYAINRFLRIIPLFVIAVGLYVAIGETNGLRTWQDAVLVLMFQRGVIHLWTIPVEFIFYFVLPLVVLAISISRRWGVYAPLWTLGLIVTGLSVFYPPFAMPSNWLDPGWYTVNFASGIAAAWIAVYSKPSRFRDHLATASLVAIVAIVLLFKLGIAGDWRDGLLNKSYLFGPLWAVIILAAYQGGAWSRLLSNHVLAWIGEAAFSIYLFHWAVIQAAKPLPFLVGVPLSVALSIVVGRISLLLLERPIYTLRKHRLLHAGWKRYQEA